LTVLMIFLYTIVGWLVGVAINHAADILPKRQTLRQRPYCLRCNAPRPWRAWSGLAALLGGHAACPACAQRYPTLPRAVVVEILAALLFAFLAYRYGISVSLLLLSLYTTILLLLTVTDLEHRLIFNVVIWPAILFTIAAAFFTPGMYWRVALVGGGVAFGLSYLAALVSRGGLGGGDVTLSTFLGFILGFPHILLSLGFGIFLGGFVSLALLLTRRVGLKSYIPYGPFLTLTGWVMLIWGAEIWRYYFG
jgi:prepilin signal peptidase PulO-like enzyme (type II secretory pathway)